MQSRLSHQSIRALDSSNTCTEITCDISDNQVPAPKTSCRPRRNRLGLPKGTCMLLVPSLTLYSKVHRPVPGHPQTTWSDKAVNERSNPFFIKVINREVRASEHDVHPGWVILNFQLYGLARASRRPNRTRPFLARPRPCSIYVITVSSGTCVNCATTDLPDDCSASLTPSDSYLSDKTTLIEQNHRPRCSGVHLNIACDGQTH